MKSIELSTQINAPVEKVFAVITDFAGAPGRISGIKSVRVLTDGPTRVGTRFVETRVMFGKEASETMEVTSIDPGRGYTLTANSCGCKYESSLRLEPNPQGARLTMTFDAFPQSFGAKVMGVALGWLMAGQCRKAIEKDLADIKRHVESA